MHDALQILTDFFLNKRHISLNCNKMDYTDKFVLILLLYCLFGMLIFYRIFNINAGLFVTFIFLLF